MESNRCSILSKRESTTHQPPRQTCSFSRRTPAVYENPIGLLLAFASSRLLPNDAKTSTLRTKPHQAEEQRARTPTIPVESTTDFSGHRHPRGIYTNPEEKSLPFSDHGSLHQVYEDGSAQRHLHDGGLQGIHQLLGLHI